ncbi:c-type cytochrome [Thiosocius teredinicola]|uniref:c-type cytochrome n=1 Tax=Thiosocius teredinicola TaxID=1973002 RepID=UPI000990C1C1
MKKLLLMVSLASVAALGTAHAAGDAEAGKTKSATCMACHGTDGNSAAPNFPKIAGQHPDYIVKQLKEFKSGERKDATMNGMAAALSDQDMEDLAAFYSKQKATEGQAAEDKVAAGETVYRAGNSASGVSACAACHGPTGAGNPMAKFPSLSGQHADYTMKQLKDFRAGARANDAGSMMRNIAAKMTDAEIEAVAQYVQGLH